MPKALWSGWPGERWVVFIPFLFGRGLVCVFFFDVDPG